MTELLTTSAKIEKSDHYSDEFKTAIMYAQPAKPVSYTHLTLPTIYSV